MHSRAGMRARGAKLLLLLLVAAAPWRANALRGLQQVYVPTDLPFKASPSPDGGLYVPQLPPGTQPPASPAPARSPSPSPSLPPSPPPPPVRPSPSPSPAPSPSPTAYPVVQDDDQQQQPSDDTGAGTGPIPVSPAPQQQQQQQPVGGAGAGTGPNNAVSPAPQDKQQQQPVNEAGPNSNATGVQPQPQPQPQPTAGAGGGSYNNYYYTDRSPPPTNTTQVSDSSSSSSSAGGLSTGALVGIIVGAVAGAALLAAALATALLARRKRLAAAAADPSKDAAAGQHSPLGSRGGPFSDTYSRGSRDQGGGGPGDGPGGAALLPVSKSPQAAAGLLPGSATVPVPLTAAHFGEAPMRWWGSGPAALADTPDVMTPAAAAAAAAAAAGAGAGAGGEAGIAAPAAATGLEGWLGHSPTAAAAAAGTGAGTAAAAAAAYPPITCDERTPAVTGPAQQRLAAAIPDDRPLGAVSEGPVSGGQQLAGQQHHHRLGPAGTAGPMQSGQMTWEQMMTASGAGATAAAAAAATGGARSSASSAQRPASQQQQQPMADDNASVADIAASPFAHLVGAAAASSQQSSDLVYGAMSRDASGPLSPTPPPPGAQQQQHGHPLALPGVRQTNAAAAPAGATASAAAGMQCAAPAAMRSASPLAAAVPGGTTSTAPGSSSAGGGWRDWGSAAVPTSASPFAAGRPAFDDDGSLSAAVAAMAASLGSEGPELSGHRSPFAAAGAYSAASTATGGSSRSGSGVKLGSRGRPPRYSTDTAASSSTVTGQSWSSSTSSNKTPAATPGRPRVHHPGPHSPTGAAAMLAAASPFAAATPQSPVWPAAAAPRGGGGGGALALQASLGVKPTRYLSGPTAALDPHWDFGHAGVKPVRVLLQVNLEDEQTPVTLILMVSAPPPPPAVLAQIVLPSDPPNAGVDLAIDANRDLAFPSNSFLGAGAFGQVHRAVYKTRFPVAVKMLTDPGLRCPDRDTLKSFREELSIMAKLDHPHILRCYGGNLQGCPSPFIVTELCECSLDRMIHYYRRQHGTGLPLRHTLSVGLHVASALWHLHPSIVHRDLKPQNVLLDINGTAKVADFGLSRIKTHTYLSTQYVAAGTASYMAPECFAGGHVGEKADVYSLGCMLLECVTGERPWQGLNVVQVAFQVAMSKNKPALPAEDPTTCPRELLTLLDDCLSFNPRERPSSGEVMKLCAHMIRTYLPGAY